MTGSRNSLRQQPYPSSKMKEGATLYSAMAFADEGKLSVDIDEWIVRTIRRPPGGKEKAVYLTKKIVGVTWGKRSRKNGDFGWLPNTPEAFRKQFVEGDPLPYGILTTRRAALMHVHKVQKSRIKRLETYVSDAGEQEAEELRRNLADEQRLLPLIRRRITKIDSDRHRHGQ